MNIDTRKSTINPQAKISTITLNINSRKTSAVAFVFLNTSRLNKRFNITEKGFIRYRIIIQNFEDTLFFEFIKIVDVEKVFESINHIPYQE